MAITPQLQTQIAAIQSRIEAVAADASPEDLVMLAKAVEAVGGQATVFDLISVADQARGDMLQAIEAAKQAALAEVTDAASITEDILEDIEHLFGRSDLSDVLLAATVNPLPQPERGSHVLRCETNSHASVRLPAYSPAAHSSGQYLLLNRSSFVIRIEGPDGQAVGTLEPHGMAIAFVVQESAGTDQTGEPLLAWQWYSTRTNSAAINISIDQPTLMLDTVGTAYMRVAAASDGFIVVWTVSNKIRLCLLKWQDGVLIPGPVLEHPTAFASRQISLARRGHLDKYVIVYGSEVNNNKAIRGFEVVSDNNGLTLRAEQTIRAISSSYGELDAVLRLSSANEGMLTHTYGYYSSGWTYYRYSARFTISADTFTLGTDYGESNASGYFAIQDQNTSDTFNASRALFIEAGSNSPARLRYFNPTGGATPTLIANLAYPLSSAANYGLAIRFLTSDLAFALWPLNNYEFNWRLLALTPTSISSVAAGSLAVSGFANSNSLYTTVVPLVLSAKKVGFILAGTISNPPKLYVGHLTEDSSNITWLPPINLPFGFDLSSHYIAGDYSPEQNAILLTRYNTTSTPHALLVQF